jgi:hypothetical protein
MGLAYASPPPPPGDAGIHTHLQPCGSLRQLEEVAVQGSVSTRQGGRQQQLAQGAAHNDAVRAVLHQRHRRVHQRVQARMRRGARQQQHLGRCRRAA